MVKRNIPRDINQYKAKQIGPFTTRQIICLIPAAGLALGAYFGLRNIIGDASLLVAIVLALPFLLCGFVTLYNVPFEKFALQVIRTVILAPTTRRYKTENLYSEADTTAKNKKPKKVKEKRPEYKKV